MVRIGGQLSGVRWWRVLALGAAAGVSLYFGGDLGQDRLRENFLQPFANFMADGGLLALYAVLTAGAANVLTRATGAANTVQGVLLGLVSAAGIQLIGRAFGPFVAWELLAFPLLGAAGGWLGVVLSRGALVRQESLYRATGALYAVDAPRDVAAAVGENLAGPNEERVKLWGIFPRAEDDGGLALESLGSWAPPGARPWPEESRLTAEGLPALADLRRRSYRVVRGEDLPPTEREAWAERGLRSALLVPLSSPGGTRTGCSWSPRVGDAPSTTAGRCGLTSRWGRRRCWRWRTCGSSRRRGDRRHRGAQATGARDPRHPHPGLREHRRQPGGGRGLPRRVPGTLRAPPRRGTRDGEGGALGAITFLAGSRYPWRSRASSIRRSMRSS